MPYGLAKVIAFIICFIILLAIISLIRCFITWEWQWPWEPDPKKFRIACVVVLGITWWLWPEDK